MPLLDLSDDEAAALLRVLALIVDGDRYPLPSRIQTLRVVLARLKPEPVRPAAPEPRVYAPPKAGTFQQGRTGR